MEKDLGQVSAVATTTAMTNPLQGNGHDQSQVEKLQRVPQQEVQDGEKSLLEKFLSGMETLRNHDQYLAGMRNKLLKLEEETHQCKKEIIAGQAERDINGEVVRSLASKFKQVVEQQVDFPSQATPNS